MKQVYRIDADGFYLEPVLVHAEKMSVEVLIPNPAYVPPKNVLEDNTEELPESENGSTDEREGEVEVEVEESHLESEFIIQVFYREVYNIPEDCLEVAPPSFYKPKWDGEKWVEIGQRPESGPPEMLIEEKLATLERENRMLFLKNDTLADQYQFLEDVITEMIVTTLP